MKRKILEKEADEFLKKKDLQKLELVSKSDSFELRRLQKKNEHEQSFASKKVVKDFLKFL